MQYVYIYIHDTRLSFIIASRIWYQATAAPALLVVGPAPVPGDGNRHGPRDIGPIAWCKHGKS